MRAPHLLEPQLIHIPSGAVALRDDRIQKEWTVEVSAFSLSQYLVTQELYTAVCGHNPATFTGTQYPVETVSWMEAVHFCNTLSKLLEKAPCYSIDSLKQDVQIISNANGFRLPTEAEWQYACMAGGKNIRYGDLHEVAWFKDNAGGTPHPVGVKLPNAWGLYDMLGNVWEWCSDVYDETVYGSYRVFRGGGWCDQERSVMATTRRRSHPYSFKIDDLGFRIAQNISQ
jgi:formylglycine-generating enzyme required for sulfatase activity